MLVLGLLMILGCGGGKEGGAPCTADTAKECGSGVCMLGLMCQASGKKVDVCGGDACSTEQRCPSGQECVPVDNTSKSFCLPVSICGGP